MLWSIDKAWLKNIFFSVCLARVIGKLRSLTEKTECRRLQAFRVLHINKNLTLENMDWQWWKTLMCFLMAELLICTLQHAAQVSSCFLHFQGRVQMRHFLGSMSMYLHMMESMVSSEPPPIDINLMSLQKYRVDLNICMLFWWCCAGQLAQNYLHIGYKCHMPAEHFIHWLLGRWAVMLPTTPLLGLSQTCRCLSLQLKCRRGRSFSRASSKKHCST